MIQSTAHQEQAGCGEDGERVWLSVKTMLQSWPRWSRALSPLVRLIITAFYVKTAPSESRERPQILGSFSRAVQGTRRRCAVPDEVWFGVSAQRDTECVYSPLLPISDAFDFFFFFLDVKQMAFAVWIYLFFLYTLLLAWECCSSETC